MWWHPSLSLCAIYSRVILVDSLVPLGPSQCDNSNVFHGVIAVTVPWFDHSVWHQWQCHGLFTVCDIMQWQCHGLFTVCDISDSAMVFHHDISDSPHGLSLVLTSVHCHSLSQCDVSTFHGCSILSDLCPTCQGFRLWDVWCRSFPLITAHFLEDTPELLADQAIHKEVDRGVDSQQHVADGVDILESGPVYFQATEVHHCDQNPQCQVWYCAYNKHSHHYH